ncbi:MAG TPA: hotdog fold thioesterase [Gammaproteobacteria bacterium]|nr:hotdog fold thioesterase [Gammaproteobacteria bacterium]
MAIWHQQPDIVKLNERGKNTAVENLGIVFTEIGDDYIKGTMPVDHRTVQPMGLLHGGASVLLAESLGSIAANYCVNRDKFYCVGMEINANHLRSVKAGTVTGITRPLHLGATTQVWEIKIYNQAEKLVCISRLTIAVVKRLEEKQV